MKFFAVTGHPILHSRSPEIFNSIFKAQKIDAHYSRLSAINAKHAIELFEELGLSGMNVTAPFKTDIIEFLDEIDEISKSIGSVNTIVKEDGKLKGYNTDYYGVSDTLGDIGNKKILLLGAGGAAKTVIYAVLKHGAKLSIFNRTEEKAFQLSNQYNIQLCKKRDLKNTVEESDIIINTVPSGIKLIDDSWFNKNHIIFDAIYHQSSYKQIAKDLRIQFHSGEEWLINQAIPAFKLFCKNEKLQSKKIDLHLSKPKDKIIFTGFMGSGKSLIGAEVSKSIGCNFFSTDDIVSKKEGDNINDIFKKHGESYFRKAEKDVLTMLASMNGKAVISSGGGMVLEKTNRDLIRKSYLSIWLYAKPETIMQRAVPENRPLLKDNFNLEFVQKLLNQRKNLYFESSDIIIDTNNKSSAEIIKQIQSEISFLF